MSQNKKQGQAMSLRVQLTCVSALAGGALVVAAAALMRAQEAAPDVQATREPTTIEEVVATGSRFPRPDRRATKGRPRCTTSPRSQASTRGIDQANVIDPVTCHDFIVRYRFENGSVGAQRLELFAGVNKAFDEALPVGLTGNDTSSSYELIGRQFFGAIRVRF